MRLSGRQIDCIRGGRAVFAGLDFEAASGEVLAVVGPNGSGKTSLLRLIAGLLVPAGGSVGLEGGEAELTLPEQSHYLGHRDALKPALSVLENLSFWRDFLGGETTTWANASPPWALATPPICPRPTCRPASGGGFRSPACWRCAGRSGCWTSRPRRSIRAGQALFVGVMRDHLAGGGIIIAATHPRSGSGPGTADGSRGMTALAALIRRDIRIALRVGGGALVGVLFFLTVTVLMPFAIGPDLALLTRLGPAILWLGALLASLLTLDRLFTADHEDGSLDLIVMGRTPLELACAAKALAHWLAAGLPLIVATPALGLLLNLDATATSAVALTLLAGTPALTFTGMIGAALAVTLHRGGLLLAVLVLPLSIPVLIFGVAASQAAITGPLSFGTPFSILCALSLVSLVVGPFAAAAGLRHGLD